MGPDSLRSITADREEGCPSDALHSFLKPLKDRNGSTPILPVPRVPHLSPVPVLVLPRMLRQVLGLGNGHYSVTTHESTAGHPVTQWLCLLSTFLGVRGGPYSTAWNLGFTCTLFVSADQPAQSLQRALNDEPLTGTQC